MTDKSYLMLFLLIVVVSLTFLTKCNAQKAHFIAEKEMGGRGHPQRLEGAVTDRVEAQLLSALELLQTYQEAAPLPANFAEKRRNNKFEFIRFGRRR